MDNSELGYCNPAPQGKLRQLYLSRRKSFSFFEERPAPRGHKPNHFRNQDKERFGSFRIARRKSFSFSEDDYVIRLMPVGGPQDKENFGSLSIARRKSICFFEDVGQEGVATGRGELSLSSSTQGACAFCSYLLFWRTR